MAKRKVRKFSEGGWTDDEARSFMEDNVVPKRASTYSDIMKSGDTSGWTKDELEALKANEEAERPKPRVAPKPVAKPAPKPVEEAPKPAPDYSDQTSRNVPAPKTSMASAERNGPIGDAVSAAKKLKERPAARRSSDSTSKRVNLGAGVAGFKKGGSVSSASRRADGCAQRGKTRGKMV